jgi:hypothetical protein
LIAIGPSAERKYGGQYTIPVRPLPNDKAPGANMGRPAGRPVFSPNRDLLQQTRKIISESHLRSALGVEAVPLLFALTMFVSATLLFLVQPMVGKMVLPLLGGTPAVWNTCMVFYQGLLLLGYYYAHQSTSRLDTKKQTTLHAVLLLMTFGMLLIAAALTANNSPIPIAKSLSPQGDDYPFFGVIVVLTVAIGLPFFIVSTSAPLLQKWFAATGHPSAKDPYFLYAASNFGSLLALIAYPAVVEPNLLVVHQAWVWAAGFGVLVVLVIACAAAVNRGPMLTAPSKNKDKSGSLLSKIDEAPDVAPTRWRKLRWIGLGFVPSSLMLGLTTFISTDMISIPLLWIVPLSLYLITFIIVFGKAPAWVHLSMSLLMPVSVLLIAFVMTSHVQVKPLWLVVLHVANFFIVAMVCHGELAHDRPSTKHLTTFYLLMSVGGMLGGLFNALVAPIVFTFTSEYPITLVIACLLLPSMFVEKDKKVGSWTNLLDFLFPLMVFFFCCQLQAYENELARYVHANGAYMFVAVVLFTIPAVFGVLFFESSPRYQISLAILLGASLLIYAALAPLAGLVPELGPASYESAFAQAVVPHALRLLPAAILAGVFAWYWRKKGDPKELTHYLGVGCGTLVVSFAIMLGLGDLLHSKVMHDVSEKAKISPLVVLQILVYGVPAMICYFFVERPIRFGAAVAALWLAAFISEEGGVSNIFKGRDNVVYDRSFFGRLNISTETRWKLVPASLFPEKLKQGDFTGYVVLKSEDGDFSKSTYLTPESMLEAAGEGKIAPHYKIEVLSAPGQEPQTIYWARREFTTLLHGTTTHGLQERDRERTDLLRALWALNPGSALNCAAALEAGAGEAMQFPGRDPTSYYHRTGPVGAMFRYFDFRNRQNQQANTSVACIGLGTGSLSSYGHPGQDMTYFEIDTHVRKLIEPGKYFTYLKAATGQGVNIDFSMGDARISLERMDQKKFGFMLVDAFSSDAIPAHLLTKQAFQLFFQRLEEDGLLAVHISNRYLELEPVVERLARELKLEARVMHGLSDVVDSERSERNLRTDSDPSWYSNYRFASTWIIIAKTKEALGSIAEEAEETEEEIRGIVAEIEKKGKEQFTEEYRQNYVKYQRARTKNQWMMLTRDDEVGLWTDDYSPIIPILKGEWRFWKRSEE